MATTYSSPPTISTPAVIANAESVLIGSNDPVEPGSVDTLVTRVTDYSGVLGSAKGLVFDNIVAEIEILEENIAEAIKTSGSLIKQVPIVTPQFDTVLTNVNDKIVELYNAGSEVTETTTDPETSQTTTEVVGRENQDLDDFLAAVTPLIDRVEEMYELAINTGTTLNSDLLAAENELIPLLLNAVTDLKKVLNPGVASSLAAIGENASEDLQRLSIPLSEGVAPIEVIKGIHSDPISQSVVPVKENSVRDANRLEEASYKLGGVEDTTDSSDTVLELIEDIQAEVDAA